jgi:hypothetical protein
MREEWDTTDLDRVIVELYEDDGRGRARVVALVAPDGRGYPDKGSIGLFVAALEAANPDGCYITDDVTGEPRTEEQILDLLRSRRAQRARAHRYGGDPT